MCSNSEGTMTNMVIIPIHGQNLLRLFLSGTRRPIALKFHILQFQTIRFIQMINLTIGLFIQCDSGPHCPSIMKLPNN